MLPLEATHAIAETCLCVHVRTAGRAVARHADDRAGRGLSGSQVRALCLPLRRLSTTCPPAPVSSAK
jgi:hypothetical protein